MLSGVYVRLFGSGFIVLTSTLCVGVWVVVDCVCGDTETGVL